MGNFFFFFEKKVTRWLNRRSPYESVMYIYNLKLRLNLKFYNKGSGVLTSLFHF
jgi:hypothetical protein